MKIKACKTIQHSGEIVGSSDDLLMEILLRVPIKSLARFKIVSKHWECFITSPEFCLRRNPNPNPNPAVALFLPEPDDPILKYVPLFSPNNKNSSSITTPVRKLELLTKNLYGVTILQSCNGLLLCRRFTSTSKKHHHYVYNPTTNQSSNLPAAGDNSIINNVCGMSLAFDPAKSSPHYHVVCVCNDPYLVGDHLQHQIHIYSSKTRAWRSGGQPFTTARQLEFENGVYWNGAVHWIAKWFDDSLYFNINTHTLQKMPIPPALERGRMSYYFGESCDHLHYIQVPCFEGDFNVYEMKRDHSEWFIKYWVDLSEFKYAYPLMFLGAKIGHNERYCNNFTITSLVRGGEEEEEEDGSFLVMQIPGKVIRYNFVSTTCEKLHERGGMKSFRVQVGFQFIESLCFL